MTSSPIHSPVIHPDGVYASILTVLRRLMTDDERAPVEEILRMGSRSEGGRREREERGAVTLDEIADEERRAAHIQLLRERKAAMRAAEGLGVEA